MPTTINENCKFPVSYLLPKQETQQEQFLLKYPEYDGRGILMAILDSGIDPGLPGLQKTSDGRRKIIEIINCTGDGDVDTSVIQTAKNGYVKGLSGRELKIPDNWNNPSGKYHLGIKSIFELYPESLLKRIKEERKKTLFDVPHKLAVADVMRRIPNFNETVVSAEDFILESDKEKREDLLDALKRNDDLEDLGPIADCLVFHDGKEFKACIDTSFQGHLDLAIVLRNYKDSGDYARLTDEDYLNVSVNIHNQGDLLEICVISSNHGSHVANIAAAYYPDEPEKSGLAPGAQLVSLCIGDRRLLSLETGVALSRAIDRCIDLKVDLINLSYGEDVHFPGVGKIIEKFETLVYKHGIILFSSAGNNGPALSTTSTPGGTSSCSIGVGAFISPEMMDYMYSKNNKIGRSFYQWSSRGPSSDGALGVSICAPGAAITSVACCSLKKAQLLNGTSMSSPNAAGSTACLLSALKANSIHWSPYLIRLAIENTAKPTDDYCPLVYGCGILQVDSAFEYMKKYSNKFSLSFNGFKIRNKATGGRGIYLREFHESNQECDHIVFVKPEFKLDPEHNCDKLDFERFLILACEDSFVTHSKHLALMHEERAVLIRVDPNQLKTDSYHFTQIMAYDSKNISMGPIFRIPITIIKPLSLDGNTNKVVRQFIGEPARADSLFLSIPLDVDWISLKLYSSSTKEKTECALDVMQIIPNCARSEHYATVELLPNRFFERAVLLKGGYTTEICIVKLWQYMDKIGINLEVSLHGTIPIPRELAIFSSDCVFQFDIRNSLMCPEIITPSINFQHICETLRPIESKIFPLGPRDIFDGAPMFALELTYSYQYAGVDAAEVTVYFEGLSDYLYESPLDYFFISVFTPNKMYIGSSSSFPKSHGIRLKNGDYRIRARVHHADQLLLSSFEDLPLIVQRKLPSSISLNCYSTLNDALCANAKKICDRVIDRGQTSTVFVSRLADEKLSKKALSGTRLRGNLSITAVGFAQSVVYYPVYYVFNSNIQKNSKGAGSDKKSLDLSKVQDKVRDLLIKNLPNMKEAEAEGIIKDLEKDYPNCLRVLQAKTSYLTNLEEIVNLKHVKEIFATVDRIISFAKPEEVLQYFGAANSDDKVDSSLRESLQLRRDALQYAYIAKADILLDAHLYTTTKDIPLAFKYGLLRVCGNEKLANRLAKEKYYFDSKYNVESRTEDSILSKVFSAGDIFKSSPDAVDMKIALLDINDAYAEVMKWSSPTDLKVVLLSAKHAMANGHFGKCLQFLSKAVKEKMFCEQYLDIALIKIYEHLGWKHISSNLQDTFLHKYRDKYRPF